MSPKTCVVDIHKINGKRPPFDVYIGRAVRYTEFTRNSIWANPFFARDYDPVHIQDCLQDYADYIRRKIATDPQRYDLIQLQGKRLGCWCLTTASFDPPLRCHGQVILKLLHEAGLD